MRECLVAEAQSLLPRPARDLGVALLNGNFVMTTSNLLFRRQRWEAVGPFAALRYAHDLDWLLRAVALGRRVVLVDKPLLRYRSHGSNTISEDHAAVRAEWAMVAAAYLTVLWDRPEAPPIVWDHAAASAGRVPAASAGPGRASLHGLSAPPRRWPLDRSPLLG